MELSALQAAHVKVKSLFGAVLGNRARCELADKSDCGHNVTLYIVDCFHASAVGVFGHVWCVVGESSFGSDVPGKALVVVGVG